MRRAAAFLVLLVVGWAGGAVIASNAGAGGAEQLSQFPVDEENVLVHCFGYDVVDHVTGVMTVTAWFDKAGVPRRIVMENEGQHEVRNSATSVAVTSGYHRKFMTDVEAGRTHVVGPAYHLTVPGYGAVLFETGTVKFENGAVTVVSGQHDFTADGLVGLCPAFA